MFKQIVSRKISKYHEVLKKLELTDRGINVIEGIGVYQRRFVADLTARDIYSGALCCFKPSAVSPRT